MIDRKRAGAAFDAYTSQYDLNNSMIAHKVEHTYRVAANCERIAMSLHMDGDSVSFAWFLGLLHDIGRFGQVRQYGTFVDSVSVDHAEFGADLLFREKLIERFPVEALPEAWLHLLETAIRLHNKLSLPDGLQGRTRRFCEIIRDADKIDIFRVVAELPFEQRAGSSKGLIVDGDEASPEVMKCVMGHRCVPRALRKTRFDVHISHCCMAFELVFPESRQIVREQGHLNLLLAEQDTNGKLIWTEKERAQLRVLRGEIEAVFGEPLTEIQPAESTTAKGWQTCGNMKN